jgi:hypothetical protein
VSFKNLILDPAEIYVNKILELMRRAEKILKECFKEELE